MSEKHPLSLALLNSIREGMRYRYRLPKRERSQTISSIASTLALLLIPVLRGPMFLCRLFRVVRPRTSVYGALQS